MIERIFRIKEETVFDFREFAFAGDPLAYLFSEWVDYYRLKHAVCRAIGPESILEVGVRYGYSAITFLNACPDAKYLGIDNDSSEYGGTVGALEWAEKVTKDYHAEFLVADTQTMASFPGDFYDLIHIDGQQDGDGTFHDLEMAIEKGRFILLDGFFWSRENMLSSAYFLEKFRNLVEYSVIIPGYSGELLIKTKPSARSGLPRRRGDLTYKTLQRCYDADYYLNDCGGYALFKRTGGLELEDMRLLALFYLVSPSRGNIVLDVGCGRGELAYALSAAGASVTGIDYAEDAIGIADGEFSGSEEYRKGDLVFRCGDVLDFYPSAKFDAIVAADLIEHIEEESLERLLQKISSLLNEGGIFAVHTAPNKLNYLYSYTRKRRQARDLGLYLPVSPRSYYEDLMHINEQTPAGLRRALCKHFSCVHTWVSSLPDLAGSLGRRFSKAETREATSIFAVAAHRDIPRGDILARIIQEELPRSRFTVELLAKDDELRMQRSETRSIAVTVKNGSAFRLASLPPHPVHLSYHWLRDNGKCEVFDGLRTPIRIPLQPSENRQFKVAIRAPEKAGEYILQITMVQEHNFWFEQIMPEVAKKITVIVL